MKHIVVCHDKTKWYWYISGDEAPFAHGPFKVEAQVNKDILFFADTWGLRPGDTYMIEKTWTRGDPIELPKVIHYAPR